MSIYYVLYERQLDYIFTFSRDVHLGLETQAPSFCKMSELVLILVIDIH